MKKIEFVSVRSKLLFTYLVIGIIPLLCLICYAFSQYSLSLKKEIMKNLEISDQEVVRQLDTKFATYHSSMSQVMYDARINEIFTTNDPQRQQALILQYLVPHTNLIQSLDISLQDIVIYADDAESATGVIRNASAVRGRAFYKDAMKYGSSVSVNNSQIIYSRRFSPLVEKNTEKLMISMYIDKDLFFYDLNTKENNIGVLIRDDTGVLINHKDIRTPFVIRKNPIPKVELQSETTIRVNGESFYFYENETSVGNWKVGCYVEKNQNFFQENLNFIFLLLLILSAVIVTLSILFSKKIVSPLLFLNQKMKQVEHGDYNVQFFDVGRDEIGQLEENFNRMVCQLQKLIEFELQQEITIRDNQLETLYAQISPHFLYNTLYAINMKAIMLESPEISTLVTSLSTFYRTALNRGKSTIAVSGEMENLKSYMNIQNILHGNTFQVYYEIDEEILDCTIPNFVLQPLAENAIEHGVDMIDEPGIIVVAGAVRAGCIHLAIEDNGPGFHKLPNSQVKTGGYGLYNVDARIKLLFGKEYGLSFSASRFKGARIEIVIPRQKFTEEEKRTFSNDGTRNHE